MERAPRYPSPHPQMEMVTTDWPPQLRSRRVWSQKWLIRYSRKRSFFPPYVLRFKASTDFPPSRHPSEGYRFLAITVLLDAKDISQVGPLQWGGSPAGRPGGVAGIHFSGSCPSEC